MRTAFTLLLAASALLFWPAAAMAHGPCNCSFPQIGEPGAVVTARSHAYKVIFNPRPTDYGRAMRDTGYASAYRPEAPTRTLISRRLRARLRPVSFRVPRVPPGIYLVLIFDGTEGGQHSTWDYFHVLGAPPSPKAPDVGTSGPVSTGPSRREPTVPRSDDTPLGLIALGIAGGALGAAALAALLHERRTRGS